jgi:ABC-type multidrug transport system fused ATPase/permease subunit
MADPPPRLFTLVNIALFCGTLLVIVLSTAELLSAPVIIGMSASILHLLLASPIIQDASLATAAHGLTVSSCFLFIAMLLQLWNAFSRVAHILRHLSNLAVTAFAIVAFIQTTASKELLLVGSITAAWSDFGRSAEFEEKHGCQGIGMDTKSCQNLVEQTVADVFHLCRALRIPVGIFWGALLFYGLPAVGIVAFDDKQKITKSA